MTYVRNGLSAKTGEWPKVNTLKCFPDRFPNEFIQSAKNTTSSQLTAGKSFSEEWN